MEAKATDDHTLGLMINGCMTMARILNQGWQMAGTSPEGLARRHAADTAAMVDVIQKNKIKPN